MNQSHRGVRIRAVAVVAAGLLAAGCSSGGGHGDDRTAGTESPTATGTGLAASATPTPTAHTTAPPPYPTGAAGCHQNKGWNADQAAEWVRFGQIGSQTWSDPTWGHVRFDKASPGFDGPLCQPVAVQVQYWKITYHATGDDPLSAGDAKYSFTLAPLQRTQVRVDGRAVKDVYPPKSIGSGRPGACVGYLAAIYTGAGPLTAKELPTKILTGGLVGQSVTFPDKRVADSRLQEPSAPQTCDRSGHPYPTSRGIPTGPSGIPDLPGLLAPTTLPPLPLAPR
ncbi:hypothetical protein [Actinacidiphila paucisporea]|uniref:Uncharacterized protein n=1 Tax=Actinacidiphila paucisporea TaxID=310782 RepID=A0A1M7PQN7_9ACTN|nr:hypothetical protein [Actinacidiphila paucisporea]SHN19534.1 hypothetical protein SAMN05216499_1256 [Actinacidiphila paucisporea]